MMNRQQMPLPGDLPQSPQLHHQKPAQVPGVGIRGGRQARERRGFVGPVRAVPPRIEDHQHAPAIRKRHVTDDWRRGARGFPAPIDDKTAALEQADAGAGARPASEPHSVTPQIQRQFVQPSHRSGDRKSKLCARAQSRMARNELIDPNIVSMTEIEDASHRVDVREHVVALRPADPHLLCKCH